MQGPDGLHTLGEIGSLPKRLKETVTGVMCRCQSGDVDEKELKRLRAVVLSLLFCETHLGLLSGKMKDRGKHGAQ